MAGHGPVGDSPEIFDEDEEFASGRSAVRIASVAALGGLLFGYDSAVINGANDAIQKIYHIGDIELGIAVASALLGAAAGAVTAGRIADRIGRIAVMKIAALLFFVSAIGTGLAPGPTDSFQSLGVWWIVVFRIIGGVGVGIASVIAPAYIAETSPPGIRGRLGSLQQLAIVSGIFVSFAVNWVLQYMAGGDAKNELWLGQAAWRWMFIVMAVPAIVYGSLAFTIPESPRYLVATHRIPEARRVLTRLLGAKNLEITIDRIRETLVREDKPSWRDLQKAERRSLRHRVGRSRPVDLPAVRRDQRDLLLLQCAVAGGGLQCQRVVAQVHRDHLGGQRPYHPDRDRADRQDRPQAAVADRLDGYGGHAGDDGGDLRHCAVGIVDGKEHAS